jgi:hypothetical protein
VIDSISFCVINLVSSEPFFKESIHSVLVQKIPQFDIFVCGPSANHEINNRHIQFLNSKRLKINSLNKARNFLFTRAQKEYVVFMDHFVVLTPEWYQSIRQMSCYDIFGTRLIGPGHHRYLDWGIKKSDKTYSPLHYDEWTNKAFINGALLIMKRQVMDRIQFNVNLASWDDDDVHFCHLASEIGFRIGIIPEGTAVWHRNLNEEPFKKYLLTSLDNGANRPKGKTVMTYARNFMASLLRRIKNLH